MLKQGHASFEDDKRFWSRQELSEEKEAWVEYKEQSMHAEWCINETLLIRILLSFKAIESP